MDEKQRNALRTIVGDKLAAEIERTGKKQTEELEGMVDFKAEGKLAKRIRALLDKIEDESVRKQVEDIAKGLEGTYPRPTKQKPEEEEEEEQGKKEEEDEKAGKLAKLAKRLRMLGGRVGGASGDKLQKIAADLLKFTESEAYAKPTKAEVKPEEEEYPKPGRKEFDEVVTSVKAVTEHFSGQFSDVAEAIKSLAESVSMLMTEVEGLKRGDAEKIAQTVADTPAASLKAMVQSVIGQKSTLVDGRTSLAKDGPELTQPDNSVGGGSLGIFPQDWFTGPKAS